MKRLFFTSEKTDNRIFQYFLGFQPSDGWLLLDDETKQGRVFLDGRYLEKPLQTHEFKIEKVAYKKGILQHLSDILLEDQMVTIEKELPYAIYEKLTLPDQEHHILFTFDESSWQSQQRILKTPDQISLITQAITLTESIREYVERMVDQGEVLGMTELQLRGKLIQLAFTLGAEDEAFDVIVATGANSAIPHHSSGHDEIGVGPLLVDMGWKMGGWCSDMTRTVRVKPPELASPSSTPLSGGLSDGGSALHEEFHEVLGVVREAHDVAVEMVKVGVSFAEIARTARKVIEDAGYGDYYPHSLGHGVGLDVHEAPRVSMRSEDLIEKGMVFTIEPGIYLPGKFGVRWENIVIVE